MRSCWPASARAAFSAAARSARSWRCCTCSAWLSCQGGGWGANGWAEGEQGVGEQATGSAGRKAGRHGTRAAIVQGRCRPGSPNWQPGGKCRRGFLMISLNHKDTRHQDRSWDYGAEPIGIGEHRKAHLHRRSVCLLHHSGAALVPLALPKHAGNNTSQPASLSHKLLCALTSTAAAYAFSTTVARLSASARCSSAAATACCTGKTQ